MNDDLLTTRQACAYLQVSRDTLRRLKPEREYVGARPRYTRSALDKCRKRRPRAVRIEAATEA